MLYIVLFFSWSIVKLTQKSTLLFLPEHSLSIIFSIVVSSSVFFSAGLPVDFVKVFVSVNNS